MPTLPRKNTRNWLLLGGGGHRTGENRKGGKYAELARASGMGGSVDTIAVRNLKNGLIRLRRELNLPETLVQAGVDPRSVWRNADEIVKAVLADPCCQSNPMAVEDFLVRRILEEVTGRV